MLPGTWAYVSAGAFGRAIIVSLAIQSLLEFYGRPLGSYILSPSFHHSMCVL
jgi:hypothetical protein